MRPVSTALALLALVTSAQASSAQGWVPVGPPGGDVRSLAVDPRAPNVVYLGTADGVLYRSDDGGLRWHRLRPGFPLRSMSLDELAVGPDGRLFVGYWDVAGSGGGVARSDDGGRTFTVPPGLAAESVRALALAPSDPEVVVAGTLTGVFRSDDGGASWRRLSPDGHPELRNVESVAVDPGNPDVVYAGTWHLPWKTSDGGRTWRSIPAGMIADSDVFTLTVDRRTRQTLYATACSGIYRSTDAGARWAKLRGIPSSSRRTRAFAQDPSRPESLYAGTTEGLWASDDGAATWRLLTPKALVVNAVALLPGGTVLLGCDGAGVLRSRDRGQTWTASNDGFSERFVSRVVFSRDGRRVYAGILGDRQHGGVVEAPSPAGPWRSLGSGLEGREVLSLAPAGDDVLAGTDDGVYVWTPHCGFWSRLRTAAGGLDLHPRVTDLLAVSERVLFAATSAGLLSSTDGGVTWERRALGLGGAVSALAAPAGPPGPVVAATPLGVFLSTDSGRTWEQTSPAFSRTSIHALAFLPGSTSVVLATTTRGLFKSTDLGRTWFRPSRGLPPSDITGLALHADGRTVFASDFADGGVYRSEDAGETWQPVTTDGLTSSRVWSLAVEPASSARLIAAAPSGGLHLLSSPVTGASAGAP
jgi:photosystem II stability/assembly factor-like uncharacterized protein